MPRAPGLGPVLPGVDAIEDVTGQLTKSEFKLHEIILL